MIGSIGFPELVLIFIVVLLVFGPKKLPEFAKFMGKAMREFRKTVNEARSTIEEEIEKADISGEIKGEIKEIEHDIREMTDMKKAIEDTGIGQDFKALEEDFKEMKDIAKIDDGKERKEKKDKKKK